MRQFEQYWREWSAKELPGNAVNPLKSFTKLAVVIEEIVRDFKAARRPDSAVIDNQRHDRYFYRSINGRLSTQ
jgi:hypothetical protein